MGTRKKEASRKERQGKTSDGMANVKTKGENFYRSAKKVKTLNMFKDGKAQRNAEGTITKAASYQSRDAPVARVEPNRKWFGNTRVISQDALEAFRGAVAEQSSDPYSYLLKQNKLPMSLIHDNKNTKNGLKQHQAKIAIETAPFKDTFGPKAQRKRVKLGVSNIEDLVGDTAKSHDTYVERLEQQKLLSGRSGEDGNEDGEPDDLANATTAREAIFSKGQSKRIWNELYKVIDSSDVIIHVLDARDPEGTRCRHVEKFLKEEAPHKHLLFVLNKVDLVPSSIALRFTHALLSLVFFDVRGLVANANKASWVRRLSKEYPTLAFHASVNNSFGKGSLIQLLRQFSSLHSDRKQISVGFVGYPNTGKSSIINTLRKKKVCTVAPIAGETKVWQYITLMKRIYLIDCPGIVPPSMTDTDEQLLLRGVVRVENVENPEQYIEAVLSRCQQRHLQRTYEVKDYSNAIEFLEKLGRKGGRLLKGGEVDLDGVAKMVLNDFLRGKIPWFTPPPPSEQDGESGVTGREGRLGEMGKKRKREDEETTIDAAGASSPAIDEEFEGFDDNDVEVNEDDNNNDDDSDSIPSDAVVDLDSEDSVSGVEDTDAATLVAPESDEESSVTHTAQKPKANKRRKKV
ncbi:NGP1NT-domain-containing protein [Pseudovirgaria hyperparasitica]|uniref:Nucleolar GTP-binding protein 2 n=1 Tax=Pseudovirgaria hyperparasitica TaxID=470096 RepID=A0A6A6VZ53_9PEZI|nr:NGP1NT-domain-containing protein [Pseudovirgaria hyperparasitica]KAF2755034.1 NGP1NT-domain-containing protein [Pseudovirgaria hyperparasitica]